MVFSFLFEFLFEFWIDRYSVLRLIFADRDSFGKLDFDITGIGHKLASAYYVSEFGILSDNLVLLFCGKLGEPMRRSSLGIKTGDKIKMFTTCANYDVVEIGYNTPKEVKVKELKAGEATTPTDVSARSLLLWVRIYPSAPLAVSSAFLQRKSSSRPES